MTKLFVFACLLVALLPPPTPPVQVVNLAGLQQLVQQPNDTLYVVNFWATWCKPCVEELPYFEQTAARLAHRPVQVLLVSLDGLREKNKVEKFWAGKYPHCRGLLLNEPNPNYWINAIDSSWSGAIPATVLYQNGRKLLFREESFTQPQLDTMVNERLAMSNK
ncbi:MAG: TlpA family protein disulfide reductase [Bacteroidetes bacterium]|nr:TlpA family protein disulfide reductase [Bacteroidota bacterium]